MQFVNTCIACPEQYNVYDNNNRYVGYIRLRWGRLRVDDALGYTVYSHDFGDHYKGCFDSDDERELYFQICTEALREKL